MSGMTPRRARRYRPVRPHSGVQVDRAHFRPNPSRQEPKSAPDSTCPPSLDPAPVPPGPSCASVASPRLHPLAASPRAIPPDTSRTPAPLRALSGLLLRHRGGNGPMGQWATMWPIAPPVRFPPLPGGAAGRGPNGPRRNLAAGMTPHGSMGQRVTHGPHPVRNAPSTRVRAAQAATWHPDFFNHAAKSAWLQSG